VRPHYATTFFGFLAALPVFVRGFGATEFGHVMGIDLVAILQGIGTVGLGIAAADARRLR
jgi:hypothetical protein